MRLKNKIAIVTGAAMGIGKGIARVFANEGAKVAIVDINEAEGRKTCTEIREAGGEAIFIRADVSNEQEIREMVKEVIAHYQALHILVNNAGIGVYKNILETSSEEWDRCLGVNLKGVFLCSKYSVPYIINSGGGSIINIASVHAVATTANTAPYAASKGGVLALTRNMAIDLAKYNIRVNAICPGWVYTPLIENIFKSSGDSEAMRKRITERQLLKRLGTPEDIGYAALYLASDEASFVTGTALFVDGGLTAVLEEW